MRRASAFDVTGKLFHHQDLLVFRKWLGHGCITTKEKERNHLSFYISFCVIEAYKWECIASFSCSSSVFLKNVRRKVSFCYWNAASNAKRDWNQLLLKLSLSTSHLFVVFDSSVWLLMLYALLLNAGGGGYRKKTAGGFKSSVKAYIFLFNNTLQWIHALKVKFAPVMHHNVYVPLHENFLKSFSSVLPVHVSCYRLNSESFFRYYV